MRLRYVFILLMLLNLLSISAQEIEKVHGEYTYHVPDNVSLEEGKRTALERAKIQALADAFGTLVSQNNSTIIKNENGKSSVDFLSIGGSDVKGEWIETIGEPKFDIFYESNMLTIKVTIVGKARESRMQTLTSRQSSCATERKRNLKAMSSEMGMTYTCTLSHPSMVI